MKDVISEYLTRQHVHPHVARTLFSLQLVRANHPDHSEWSLPHQHMSSLHEPGRFMQSWDNKHRCGQGKLCGQLTLHAEGWPRGPCKMLGAVKLNTSAWSPHNWLPEFSPLVTALANFRKWSHKKETEKAQFGDQRCVWWGSIVVVDLDPEARVPGFISQLC